MTSPLVIYHFLSLCHSTLCYRIIFHKVSAVSVQNLCKLRTSPLLVYMKILSWSYKFLYSFQGKEQNKPESTPLHIQNPFETGLNVSKNVNATQLERFVALCRESAWLLEQKEVLKRSTGQSADVIPPWGLAALLLPSVAQSAGVKGRKKKKHHPASERIKNLLESLKSNSGGAGAKPNTVNGHH